MGTASGEGKARYGESACVGAFYVGTIRETDGDAVCCWLDSLEIAQNFKKMPGGSRIDYNWRGGGRHFGRVKLSNSFYVSILIRMCNRPS
jgi:hypothetical protein